MEKKLLLIALMPIIGLALANGKPMKANSLQLPNDTLKTISTTVTCYDTKDGDNVSKDSCGNAYKTVTTNTVVFNPTLPL